jgi:hypothetical protein
MCWSCSPQQGCKPRGADGRRPQQRGSPLRTASPSCLRVHGRSAGGVRSGRAERASQCSRRRHAMALRIAIDRRRIRPPRRREPKREQSRRKLAKASRQRSGLPASRCVPNRLRRGRSWPTVRQPSARLQSQQPSRLSHSWPLAHRKCPLAGLRWRRRPPVVRRSPACHPLPSPLRGADGSLARLDVHPILHVMLHATLRGRWHGHGTRWALDDLCRTR